LAAFGKFNFVLFNWQDGESALLEKDGLFKMKGILEMGRVDGAGF